MVIGSYLDNNNLTKFPATINDMPLLTYLYVMPSLLATP
jgi:hypothetical protein